MEYSYPKLKEIIPKKEVIDRIPVFNIEDGFKGMDRDKVINWIAFVYHPITPLATVEETAGVSKYIKRKFIAGKEAGFPEHKAKSIAFKDPYEDIILGKNEFINSCIIAYLKLFNSPIYARLKVITDSYYNQLNTSMQTEAIETKDSKDIKDLSLARKAVQETLDNTEKKLQEIELTFMQGDDSKPMLEALYQEISLEGLGLKPEEIAQMRLEGKDPLLGFKPYYL